VLDQAENMAALRVREIERFDDPAKLPGIVVGDCRFDSLANSLALGELATEPT
jgi:hypothetical protein